MTSILRWLVFPAILIGFLGLTTAPAAMILVAEVRDDAGSKPNRKTLVSRAGWRAGCSPRCPNEPGHMENLDLKVNYDLHRHS